MGRTEPTKTVEQLADDSGKFPADAFHFVREGLQFTLERMAGDGQSCQQHISGEDLCWGLRDYALKRWGLLAPAVLQSWNVKRTEDFGKIVFAMVETGWMAKNDSDTIDDFNRVYDFEAAFEGEFEIE